MSARDGMTPLRVAVIGTGWAAREIWLPRLRNHPGFTVTALVDPEPAARAAANDGGQLEFDTAADLPPQAVDLAVVAAPNHLHATLAETLLGAGIPTFVEKPVCLNSAEAQRLTVAEAVGDTVLLAGSAARYRADVRTLTDQADSVGEIRHISLSWVRARGIPNGVGWFTHRQFSGGGALVDLGWHLLDVGAPLLGDAPFTQIVGAVSNDFINDSSAQATWRRDKSAGAANDVEDTARGFLLTQDGPSVSLTARWASHQPRDITTIVVEGSTGTLTLTCTFGFSPNRQERSALTLTRKGEQTPIPIPHEPVGAEYDRLLDELPQVWADPASRGVAMRETSRNIDAIERLYASASARPRRTTRPTPVVDLPARTGARAARTGADSAPARLGRALPVRAVVFDLDGVLVDSFGVMRKAFTHAYHEVVGADEPPFDEYNRHLGRYFPDIMRIMGLPLEMEGPFVRESSRLAGEITLFPGVHTLLELLRERGIVTAVATGKAGWRARELLERLGVLHLLDHVIGSDEVTRAKPAPDIVLRALHLLGVASGEAVMVGDAVTDLAAAKGAGVTAVAALWGETDEPALIAAAPDHVLREPDELALLCRPVAAEAVALGRG